MPKVDLDRVETVNRTGYPAPFHEPVAGRYQQRVGKASGLTHFGANLVRLEPGAWSSQRHWHEGEDELLVMLDGQATLVEDEGRQILRRGDIVSWPAGARNGHHLINEGDEPCRFLVIGAGEQRGGAYSDIDMVFTADGDYQHRDGTPYPARKS
jgi:uncharacterized cupin superfamily protein